MNCGNTNENEYVTIAVEKEVKNFFSGYFELLKLRFKPPQENPFEIVPNETLGKLLSSETLGKPFSSETLWKSVFSETLGKLFSSETL